MSKIVLDSDGLIKLQKAGVLKVLASRCECVIPEAVYKESVEDGKKGLYEDAFLIEKIVDDEIKRVKINRPIEELEKIEENKLDSLGEGEKEVFQLYFQEEVDAVISDDRAFLNILDRLSDIDYLTPCNAIYIMYKKGIITKKESLMGLNQIKDLVRFDVYQKVIKKIKGGE
ncbi:MAG: hypothetical protein ACOC1V_07200 [Candidatus Saliniplasma sp.]